MQIDECGDQREAKATAFMRALKRAVDLMERQGQVFNFVCRNSDPVIRHRQPQSAFRIDRDRQCNPAASFGEFHGVRQQVQQNLLENARVGEKPRQSIVNFDIQSLSLPVLPAIYNAQAGLRNLTDIERLF